MGPPIPRHPMPVPPSSPSIMVLDAPSSNVPPADQNPSARDEEGTTTPSAGTTEAVPVSPITPAPILPHLFNSTDTSLSWVGRHPYWNCEALGHGAFGSVRKVSLLTPLGYTVSRDAKGMLKFNAKDDILLRPMRDEEWVRLVGGDDAILEGLKASVSDSKAVEWCQQLNFSGLFCAAKTIAATRNELFQRACEEIELLKQLAHSEHVVRMYNSEAIWSGELGKVVIVMELGEMDFGDYLKSRTLTDENDGAAQDMPGSGVFNMTSRHETSISQEGSAERRWMGAFEIFGWWKQMVAGVQAAHSHDIMHCDIKPSNFIMVRKTAFERASAASSTRCEHEEYTLKLCDFGVSRQLVDLNTHLSIVNAFGTLLYMSPEMLHTIEAHGKLHVTKAVDMWGLGVILHQMLHNGATPYGHLLQFGKWRLAVAIPDEKAARMQTACPRLLEGEDQQAARAHASPTTVPGILPLESDFLSVSTTEQGAQRRHDILLGLQLSCLQRPVDQRPTAIQLRSLNDTAEQLFFHGPRDGIVQPGSEIDGGNNNSRNQREAPETANGSARDDGNSASVREDNSTAETIQRGQSVGAPSVRRNEDLMALKALMARAVAATAPMCMALSSDATSRGPHGQREGTPSTVGLLSEEGSSTSVDHATSNNASPLAPAQSFESHADDESSSSRRNSCGVKEVLISIGLSFLLVIATGLIGFKISSSVAPGGGETICPTNGTPGSNIDGTMETAPAPVSFLQPSVPGSTTIRSPPATAGRPTGQGSPSNNIPQSNAPQNEAAGDGNADVPQRSASGEGAPSSSRASPSPPPGASRSGAPVVSEAPTVRQPESASTKATGDQAMDTVPEKSGGPGTSTGPYRRWRCPWLWQESDIFQFQQAERNTVLAEVSRNGPALQYAAKKLQEDEDFVKEVVSQNGWTLRWAAEKLKKDKDIVTAAVSQNGLALYSAAEELQKDRDIVKVAVSQNGRALQWAAKELQGDKDIVKVAVLQYGWALQWAAEELQGDKDIVKWAVSENGSAIQWAAEELRGGYRLGGPLFSLASEV